MRIPEYEYKRVIRESKTVYVLTKSSVKIKVSKSEALRMKDEIYRHASIEYGPYTRLLGDEVIIP